MKTDEELMQLSLEELEALPPAEVRFYNRKYPDLIAGLITLKKFEQEFGKPEGEKIA